MAYIGQGIKQCTFKVLDTSGNTYNGSNTTFSLGTQVGAAAQLLVSHDGVIQKPGTDYTLASGGASITFSTAPASGASIFIVEISGAVGGTVTPSDNSVGVTQLNLSDGSNGQAITTDGSGTISFSTISTSLTGIDDQSSSNDDQLTITDTAVVINEDSDDVDFRVESNGNANMLFVSGGNDVVGIGAEGDLGVGLHIKSADSSATVSGDGDELVIENGSASNMGMTLLSPTNGQAHIMFGDSGDNDIGFIAYNHDDNSMKFRTNASERVRIRGDGNFCVASSNTDPSANNVTGCTLQPSGRASFSRDSDHALDINRQSDDGAVAAFRQAGSTEGSISISGSTTSYVSFSGSHWSRLADNSKPTILRGTVMESISTMVNWYGVDYTVDSKPRYYYLGTLPDGKSVGDNHTITVDGVAHTGTISKENNEQLPMCKISDTEDSKAVYGVFMTWDNDDDAVNDMYVTSLGAFVVRIHKDETVAIGDYLQSKGDGTAKKQADDILRASTIAKVTSTEKTHTYDDGSYCVPCTLHCGQMSKLSVNNTYFTPVKKRTSIGDSSRSRPKNKSTRRLHKRTRGQGKP